MSSGVLGDAIDVDLTSQVQLPAVPKAGRSRFDIPQEDNYSCHLMEVIRSSVFDKWLSGLRDRQAMARIGARLDRLAVGHFGDVASVGGGVTELRIDYGPGYRVYCLRRGEQRVVLLCGGDKSSQVRDITRAQTLAENWKD